MVDVSEVAAVQLMVKAFNVCMSEAEFDALPDRQSLMGLPVDGLSYRDSAHPKTVFKCRAGTNWARYTYEAFPVTLTGH